MSRLAASVALAGVALIGVTVPAVASKGHDKPSVCHPTGKGWTLINPAQASSHIDEAAYPNGHYWKHEHNGRHDVYAVSGACPVVPSTPTPTTTGGTPSTPSATPTHTSASPTATSTSSTTSQPTSTSPSPSPTSSTSTTRSTNGTPSQTEPPAKTSHPQIASTTRSTPTKPSPRRSVPSSTVAPPNQLAHTGAGLVTGFLVGLGILLVGALFHVARILGGRRGEH